MPAGEARARPQGVGELRAFMRQESLPAFDRRARKYDSLKTAGEIATYQRELRGRFLESLGGFPERTPLNARVVGEVVGEGYRAEKIIFESQPGFFVTGLLYLPAVGSAPHPIMLMPLGHSENGKGNYQLPSIILARNGVAVFSYDPIGQGERKQILADAVAGRDDRRPGRYSSTAEHMIAGIAPILLGRSLATYMIWDGIRAIDYLETRRDLDVKRLGCAGVSGGGLMTSYLMALDPRIVAAAPGCFITTSRWKNDRIGPGDAEQNLHAQYVYGLDHADFLILHAPKPALILAATRDFVPIEGTWEAFREAKRIYARLGHAERMDLIETDTEHAYSVQLREGTARWMRRWLLQKDDAVFEQPAEVFKDRDIECTLRGQVLLMAGARSVFDLNRAEAARLAPKRKEAWKALGDDGRREAIRRAAVIRPFEKLPGFRVESRGAATVGTSRAEQFVILPAEGIQIPGLRVVPENPTGRACLYLHGRGKDIDAAPGGPIERLVREGTEVFAVDLRGFGETAMKPWRYADVAEICGNNAPEYFVAYMLGRSFTGMRAEDVLVAARAVAGMRGEGAGPLQLIALEEAAVPALHAAALEPRLFAGVKLVRAIASWERVLEVPVPKRQLEGIVHGALRVYDLPDLAALAGGVEYVELVDAAGRAVK